MACPPGSEITVGGIIAKVAIDGVAKGNDSLGGGPWRDIIYQVAGDDSDNFMDALLGVGAYGGTVGSSIVFPDPHRYPGNTNLVALAVSAEPVTVVKPDTTKIVASDLWHVRCHYGVPQFDVGATQPDLAFGGQPQPWTRDTVRGFFHSYPVPKQGTVKDGTGDPLDKKFEWKIPHLEFHRTRMMVPYLDLMGLSALVGKVNGSAMWGFNRGTLRLEPFDSSVEVMTDGSRMITLDTTLTWRPYDWNMDIDTDGTWVLVGPDAGGTFYEYADFSPLFG
jgi:hypothetical protein